jgi:hypothetical protein
MVFVMAAEATVAAKATRATVATAGSTGLGVAASTWSCVVFCDECKRSHLSYLLLYR